jgi:hypothetical protein
MRDFSNVQTKSSIPTRVTTVNNIMEAQYEIEHLIQEGYNKEQIYVLAHDSERTKHAD